MPGSVLFLLESIVLLEEATMSATLMNARENKEEDRGVLFLPYVGR